jgi:hypothetical protein
VTSLRHCNEEIEELKAAAVCPLPIDLLCEHNLLSLAGVGCLPSRGFVHPIFGVPKSSDATSPAVVAPAQPTASTMKLTGSEFFLSLTDPSRLAPLPCLASYRCCLTFVLSLSASVSLSLSSIPQTCGWSRQLHGSNESAAESRFWRSPQSKCLCRCLK